MKKVLIISLFILTLIFSINAADIGCSSSSTLHAVTKNDGFPDIEVRLAQHDIAEEYGKGKGKAKQKTIVYVIHDEQELAAFDADLLKHTIINQYSDLDLVSDNDYEAQKLITYIKHLFSDLSLLQIKGLITILQNGSDEHAEGYVSGFLLEETVQLFKKADAWDIPCIKAACARSLILHIDELDIETVEKSYLSEIFKYGAINKVKNAICNRLPVVKNACIYSFNLGFGEKVWSEYYHCDGSAVFITTSHRGVNIDLKTGQQQIFIPNENESIEEVCYNHNGSVMLIGASATRLSQGQGYRVISMDLKNGQQQQIFAGNDKHIDSLCYNHDSSAVLIATKKRAVVIDLKSGQQQIFMSDDTNVIRSVCFNHDGSVVLIQADQSVISMDLKSGQQQQIFHCEDNEHIWPLCCSPDGSAVLIRTGKRVISMDLASQKQQIFTAHEAERPERGSGDNLRDFAVYNRDGSALLIMTKKRVVSMDLKSGQQRQIYTCGDDWPEKMDSVRYSPDCSAVLIQTDRSVVSMDLKSARAQQAFERDDNEYISSACYNHDGSAVLIRTKKRVVSMDLKNGQQQQIFDYNDNDNERRVKAYYDYDGIISAYYNYDCSAVLIATRKGVVSIDLKSRRQQEIFTPNDGENMRQIKPISAYGSMFIRTSKRMIANVQRDLCTGLDLAQKQLLYRALKSWDLQKAYQLNNDELDIYANLPEELKSPELFSVPETKKDMIMRTALTWGVKSLFNQSYF